MTNQESPQSPLDGIDKLLSKVESKRELRKILSACICNRHNTVWEHEPEWLQEFKSNVEQNPKPSLPMLQQSPQTPPFSPHSHQ